MRPIGRLFSLLCVAIALVTTIQAQELVQCSMPSEPQEVLAAQTGGLYKPSTGILKVLVVFTRFNGDNETNARWPNADVMPNSPL